MRALLLTLIIALAFCAGYFSQIHPKPEVITVSEYVPIEKVRIEYIERIVEVPVEVLIELKPFPSHEFLSRWVAQNKPEKVEGWNCVDYALELQRGAIEQGYQMSTEVSFNPDGKTGHMICSAVIGNEIIFIEPQSGISWVGGVKE